MNMKKYIAFVLAACLCLTSFMNVFAAANFDDDGNRTEENGLDNDTDEIETDFNRPVHELDNPDDVYIPDEERMEYLRLKAEYDTIIAKLKALSIWPELSEGEHTEPITRAEYAAMIIQLINGENYTKQTVFSDTQSSPYEKEIGILAALGYIQGFGDGTFRPEQVISYQEAVNVLVRALGYGEYAAHAHNGDLMITAYEKELIKNRNFSPDHLLNRLNAAYLINDACDAQAVDNAGAMQKIEYKNTLEKFHHILVKEGIVTAVGDIYIDPEGAPAGKNNLTVGGMQFYNESAETLPYLGYRAAAYYREDSTDSQNLLYLFPDEDNSVLELSGDDIAGYTNGNLNIYRDSATKRIMVRKDILPTVNYFEPMEADEALLKKADRIVLISNDRDSVYDVMLVFSYEVAVVDRLVKEQNKIFTKDGAAVDIDFENQENQLLDRTGNPVETYYITENSVLSVGRNPQGSGMRILISNTMYNGKVSSVTTSRENGKKQIAIGEKIYEYSTNEEKLCENGGGLKAGKTYTVYLDYMKRIAGYEEQNSEDILFGYLVKAYMMEAETEGMVGIKLYPYNGDMANYALAEKVTLDGVRYENDEDLLEAIGNTAQGLVDRMKALDATYIAPDTVWAGSNTVYTRCPVLYKQNEKGEITYLDTPAEGAKEDPDKKDRQFGKTTLSLYDDFCSTEVRAGGRFFRNTLAFHGDAGHTVSIDGSLKLFIVPASNDYADINNPDNYAKGNSAYFKDWNDYPQKDNNAKTYPHPNRLEAYNVNESRTAQYMVYATTLSVGNGIDKSTPLTVIDGIETAVNEDNLPVTCLRAWQGNSMIYINLAPGVTLEKTYRGPDGSTVVSKLEKGDIIRYTQNQKEELTDYIKVFSLTDADDPNYVVKGNETDDEPAQGPLNKTLLAVSDGKYAANGHNTPHLYDSIGNYSYGASYRVVYGTVMYQNANNLVIKTTTDTAFGQVTGTEICSATNFNILCIDQEQDKIYVPAIDEIISAQSAGEEDATKVIVHTEGGKQRQLILVKRQK